jgi:hypothetical protein
MELVVAVVVLVKQVKLVLLLQIPEGTEEMDRHLLLQVLL